MFEDIDWKEVAMHEICQQSIASLVERVHDSLVELQQQSQGMGPRRFHRLYQEEFDLLIRIMSEIQNRLRKMDEIGMRGRTSTESASQTPKQDAEESTSDSAEA